MLSPEQETQIAAKVCEAKKLLLEATAIINTDSTAVFEGKGLANDDGAAWLALIGEISNRILELEKVLDVDLLVAKSFEERLGTASEVSSENMVLRKS